MTKPSKSLGPLIPLESLKQVVQALARVPKAAISKPKPEPKKAS